MKVRDKVIVIKKQPEYNFIDVCQVGTIIEKISPKGDVCIEFDNYIGGHSGGGIGKEGHCWVLNITQVKLLEESPPILRFGDVVEIKYQNETRVGVVRKDDICTAFGTHNLKFYNDNLRWKGNHYDIITRIYKNTEEGLELIWKRAEEDYIDWTSIEVDTKIQIRNSEEEEWCNRYFAKYEDGEVYVFCHGANSFTSDGSLVSCKFKRLYVEE